MVKHVIEISRTSAHLAVRNEQLLLKRDGQVIGQVSCADLGVVVVDHPQTTYTHQALVTLVQAGASVVLCGRDHLPAAVVMPVANHTQVVTRIANQMAASRPLKKQLWRQLVVAKVRAQALNLDHDSTPRKKLLALADTVKSGDTANVEALAAKVYWRHWLDTTNVQALDNETFRRDPMAEGVNSFLNYGYAILRAAIGRAIVAAGLQPCLGLHHSRRDNAFCLADDLIEPFRPIVDDYVREMLARGHHNLSQSAKAEILEVLSAPMQLSANADQQRQVLPLALAIQKLTASLVDCFEGRSRRLAIATQGGLGPGEETGDLPEQNR